MNTGRIFDVKRFAVHDGDGIRTTVFLKGCPLHCLWCHNPEGIGAAPQLSFTENNCTGCGECARVCPAAVHVFTGARHLLRRENCTACGKCTDVCPQNALRLYGRTVSTAELLPLLLEDRAFYEASGGGVTLSGGECLMQADFCAALLKLLKENGIHTAVDTCGSVPRSALEKVLPYTDVFLYDLKAFDEKVHIRCTGQSNRPILENLLYLDRCGKAAEIRVPLVPGFNDGETEGIAAFLAGQTGFRRVRVLPYHNFAASKYRACGMADTLPATLPDEEMLSLAKARFRAHGLTVCGN